ncbi:unnamed protein product [Arctia plantaginis]|uniref:CBF1-interacting co-repressor CIR N-terminal domain-containing protein n=1 Tax=Arctia plantaginis TaxID=874455 RepID=A0A8S1BKD6_ARCPL|nr:unnamed protein product [Arctia plantaginis]
MNILPKKRWHVRTKENIARVRKDEAEAEEKAKQEQIRTEKADREARLRVLKHKSKQKLFELGLTDPEPEKILPTEHLNLFANFEEATKSTNKEHDKELKEKKEEYEKKIGYLTYLGQDTNEALGKKNWYEVLPESSRSSNIKDTYEKLVFKDADGKPKNKKTDEKDGEVCWKNKQSLDPMKAFKHLLPSHKDNKSSKKGEQKLNEDYSSINEKYKHKNKKNKHHRDRDNEIKLQKLREARLRREQQEKYRTEMFLTALNKPMNIEVQKDTKMKPKYNSQFNPELARQNYR